MGVHGLGIGMGHDQRGGRPALGADGTEDVGPICSGYRAGPSGAAAAVGPDAGEGALLPDPCLKDTIGTMELGKTYFQRLAPGLLREDFLYRGSEVFLKASCASGSVFGC